MGVSRVLALYFSHRLARLHCCAISIWRQKITMGKAQIFFVYFEPRIFASQTTMTMRTTIWNVYSPFFLRAKPTPCGSSSCPYKRRSCFLPSPCGAVNPGNEARSKHREQTVFIRGGGGGVARNMDSKIFAALHVPVEKQRCKRSGGRACNVRCTT